MTKSPTPPKQEGGRDGALSCGSICDYKLAGRATRLVWGFRHAACSFLNRLLKPRTVTLLFGGLQYEYRNDFGCSFDCVPTWWRRLVLGSRSRLTRPVCTPDGSSVAATGFWMLGTGGSTGRRLGGRQRAPPS